MHTELYRNIIHSDSPAIVFILVFSGVDSVPVTVIGQLTNNIVHFISVQNTINYSKIPEDLFSCTSQKNDHYKIQVVIMAGLY